MNHLKFLVNLLFLLFPSPPSTSSLSCFLDSTPTTCPSTSTLCLVNATSASPQKGGGCLLPEIHNCQIPTSTPTGSIFCDDIENLCCCQNPTDTEACNDLSILEKKKQACSFQLFKGKVTTMEPNFCPTNKCIKDNKEIECPDGNDYCAINTENGQGSGCVPHDECGGAVESSSQEITCQNGHCCCFAGAEPCNVLTKNGAGCQFEELKKLDLCMNGPSGNKNPGDKKSAGEKIKYTGIYWVGIVKLVKYFSTE